jgi:hypothetical protein
MNRKILAAAGMALSAALVGPLVSAPPAAAASQHYSLTRAGTGVSGNLAWLNRSVKVGGTVHGTAGRCAAVVYTGYSGTGRIVARGTRPGDNAYTCGSLPHGFVLDAGGVHGGITRVDIDLWVDTGVLARSATCYRTITYCTIYS